MPRITKELLTEALDLVLQQQFISDSGALVNRTKKESFSIPGTKLTYVRIKNAIMEGIQYVISEQFDRFMEFLGTKFQVPVAKLNEKFTAMGDQQAMLDTRMKFIMIVSTLREYWQDLAYQQVLGDICRIIANMNLDIVPPSTKEVNTILSTHFGPDFSMMVNLHVLKEMGQAVGTPLKIDDAWYEMMDRLAAEVAAKMAGSENMFVTDQ
ncbi:MAG TPA: hypothetical protein VKM55_12010 [Candidatus Lokiarchaeia archaeon]|nr:hypothetical protein [Candidatus Lokiarchaeia archaeon]